MRVTGKVWVVTGRSPDGLAGLVDEAAAGGRLYKPAGAPAATR